MTCSQCQKYEATIKRLKKELKEYYQESQDTVGRLAYTIKESSMVKQMKQQLTSARKQITELKRDKQELMQNIDEAVKIAEYYKAKLQNIRTPKYNQQAQLLQEQKRVNAKIRKLYEETHPKITCAKKIQSRQTYFTSSSFSPGFHPQGVSPSV